MPLQSLDKIGSNPNNFIACSSSKSSPRHLQVSERVQVPCIVMGVGPPSQALGSCVFTYCLSPVQPLPLQALGLGEWGTGGHSQDRQQLKNNQQCPLHPTIYSSPVLYSLFRQSFPHRYSRGSIPYLIQFPA